jgi:hypothetical protein
MERQPKRTRLVTEAAQTLKERISTRVSRGTPPGELPLHNRRTDRFAGWRDVGFVRWPSQKRRAVARNLATAISEVLIARV